MVNTPHTIEVGIRHRDRLTIMFEMQDALENLTTGSHFSDIGQVSEDREDHELRIKQFVDMTVAGIRETVEQLDEMGSKPWATSKHFNEAAVQKELVDEWHFFMAKCLLARLTPEKLYRMYKEKWEINVARQHDGYDGVSTKCPQCKRALDDSEGCWLIGTGVEKDLGYCVDKGYYREEVTSGNQ
jgi:hypothetical protein